METFSALLAICAGNSPVPGEIPTQRPVTRSFNVYFDLRPNKRLSKQWWGWWFETQSCPLWCHRNVWYDTHKPWVHVYTTRKLSPRDYLNRMIGTQKQSMIHKSSSVDYYTVKSCAVNSLSFKIPQTISNHHVHMMSIYRQHTIFLRYACCAWTFWPSCMNSIYSIFVDQLSWFHYICCIIGRHFGSIMIGSRVLLFWK